MGNSQSNYFIRIIYKNKTEDVTLIDRGNLTSYYCQETLHNIIHMIDNIDNLTIHKSYYDKRNVKRMKTVQYDKIIFYFDNDPKNGLVYTLNDELLETKYEWFLFKNKKIDRDTICQNPKDEFLRYANYKLKKHCVDIILT